VDLVGSSFFEAILDFPKGYLPYFYSTFTFRGPNKDLPLDCIFSSIFPGNSAVSGFVYIKNNNYKDSRREKLIDYFLF